MPGYLEELTLRLARDIAGLPEETRARHAAYLKSNQQADGGFAGREGDSDLYYTAFGLRGMAMLGELYGEASAAAARFVDGRLEQLESVIDIVSAIYSIVLLDMSAGIDVLGSKPGCRESMIASLESLRREDGGYAKTPLGKASSTYHTFLVVLGLQLLQSPIREPDRIVAFVRSQRMEGGAFREIRVTQRGGANPTAAAIGILRILDALDEAQRVETISFLLSMQTEEGGLRANTRIPAADLLSTFTGMLTLVDVGAASSLERPLLLRFVESCERREGGFRGALWDDGHDVEYTFYGLGSLALLNSAE